MAKLNYTFELSQAQPAQTSAYWLGDPWELFQPQTWLHFLMAYKALSCTLDCTPQLQRSFHESLVNPIPVYPVLFWQLPFKLELVTVKEKATTLGTFIAKSSFVGLFPIDLLSHYPITVMDNGVPLTLHTPLLEPIRLGAPWMEYSLAVR